MSRIFISHSSANNAAALALSQWLGQEGWDDHFLDIDSQRGLAPGQRWQAALAVAVDRCEAVIFVISPAWRDSRWCLAEFHQAKALGKPIFGVIVEGTPLESLPAEMTVEWQLCDLVAGQQRLEFDVASPPLVAPTHVSLATDGLQRLHIGLSRAGLDPSTFPWPPADEPDRSPYPGLRALDAQDAAVFFGRDASIVRAIDQLRLMRERGVDRLFVILGASGAGKSSFLRAGLLPRLERDREHLLVLRPVRPERAAVQGTDGLLASLQRAAEQGGLRLTRAELRNNLASAAALATLLRRIVAADTAVRRVVLPIDQAEELFSADGGAEARELLDLIAAVDAELCRPDPATGEEGRLHLLVVLTIRSDSMEAVQREPALSGLGPVLFSLPPMPAAEFKAVIEGPAQCHRDAGHRLSILPELSERLVEDAQGADALPLLALTLEWLFREYGGAERVEIGIAQYEQLGGVRGAIEVAVRRALERPQQPPSIPSQPLEQQRLLNECFPPLVTLDAESGEPKRRVAGIDEFLPAALPLIERLETQRLLLRDRRPIDGQDRSVVVIEVAHEALLRQWDAMTRWLGDFGDALKALEALRRAASDWMRKDRDPVWLVHSGYRLDAAEALFDHAQLKQRLGATERDYVAAARRQVVDRMRERERELQAVAEHQEARARLQRRSMWGLSAAGAVLLAMALWVVNQTRAVSLQTSLVLTDAAERADNDRRYERGMRFGVLATRSSWLQRAHPTAAPQLARAAHGSALLLELIGHRGPVVSAIYSPDGRRILTLSHDTTARLWDATSGEPVGAVMRHGSEVHHGSFSPDGRRVLTRTENNMLRLWDAVSGEAVGDTFGGTDFVGFSPDGKRLALLRGDLNLQDAETGTWLPHQPQRQGNIKSFDFSPDGRHVLAASGDRTVRLLSAETGAALGAAMPHDGEVSTARFSPDGLRVVTASADGTVRLWDAGSGEPVLTLSAGASAYVAGYSQDSRRIIARVKGGLRVWDAQSGALLGSAAREADLWPTSIVDHGGRALLTDALGQAELWDVENHKFLREMRGTYNVTRLRFDGKRLLWSAGRRLELLDGRTGGTLLSLSEARGEEAPAAEISPDGRSILAATAHNARLWSADSGAPVAEDLTHEGEVHSARFSPDGKRIVTASADHTARVWDALRLRPTLSVAAVPEGVAYSADGKRLLVHADPRSVRVLEIDGGRPVGETLHHPKRVLAAAFSRDGHRVVTVARDGVAREWDAASGKPISNKVLQSDGFASDRVALGPYAQRVLYFEQHGVRLYDAAGGDQLGYVVADDAHGQLITAARFSADGSRIVAASSSSLARGWDARSGKPEGAPLPHDGPVLDAALSADGTRIVTQTESQVQVWDAGTSRPVGKPLAVDSKAVVAISPDGMRVVVAALQGTARLWDFERGEPVGAVLEMGPKVSQLLFSPDGRMVAAAFGIGARVWDASTGKPLSDTLRHEHLVESLQVSPDGRSLLTTSERGLPSTSEERVAQLWSLEWPGSLGAVDLVAKVCAQRLLGSLRRITTADVVAAPILGGRVGEDVCTGVD